MFAGIDNDRLLNMTDQQRRWLTNIKKAFYESDHAYGRGKPEDRCIEELCKAIDTAKTLRRSLRQEDCSSRENKKRFVEFISLDVPLPAQGGLLIQLTDARSGQAVAYSFPELVYAIRCMVHENENLNAAEQPDFHVQLDWTVSEHDRTLGLIDNGRITLNARAIRWRLREILAKFITGIEGAISFLTKGQGSCGVAPSLESIRPES